MINWELTEDFFQERNWRQPRYTNSSAALSSLQNLVQQQGCQVLKEAHALAILVPEQDFRRVYYYADDAQAVQELLCHLDRLPGSTMVLEQITRGTEQAQVPADSGWKHLRTLSYLVYRRKGDLPPAENLGTEPVQPASREDCPEIYQLLHRLFDTKISHLPTMEQMEQLTEQECAWVIREAGHVVSFLLMEVTGKKTRYIYQVGTVEAARGRGYGKMLMQTALAGASEGLFYSLWVENENPAAVGLYEKMGFVSGGRTLTISVKD